MVTANAAKEDIIHAQILQAARLLLARHGFQRITMDDVAKAVGKGRSSLYYYYKSKDEIFDAVMDVELMDIRSELSGAVALAATSAEKIHAFCEAKINISRKKKEFFSALEAGMNADEISEYAKKKYAIHQKLVHDEGTLLHQLITLGIKKGELPPVGKKELKTLIFVLLSSIRGMKREMELQNDFSNMQAAINMLTQMIITTIKY